MTPESPGAIDPVELTRDLIRRPSVTPADAGAMDVVMNIAGIASWGTISAMPHSTWQRVVDINLMGPISVLEYLVPPMIAGGRGGQVVNVSSAAGIIGMPWLSWARPPCS